MERNAFAIFCIPLLVVKNPWLQHELHMRNVQILVVMPEDAINVNRPLLYLPGTPERILQERPPNYFMSDRCRQFLSVFI